MSAQPLEGLRVLELARILAGPWAGQVLADLGADVIKVEAPDGDGTRRWGPPFVNDDAAYFHGCNRGKRSLVADLRNDEDRARVRDLALSADVMIENFKVGTLARFGLDHANLTAENPRLVTCSITGFGQTGPRAGEPGFDVMIQGMSGLMSVTGSPDGPPQKAGVAFADIFTGLYGTIAVLAALRERDHTGRGAHLDLSLLDAQMSVLANQAMNYLVTGREPGRLGNAHPNLAPYQDFPTADGEVIVAVGSDRQYAALADVLDLPIEGFSTNAERVDRREELAGIVSARTGPLPREEVLDRLLKAGVPGGPINTIGEALDDPQVLHRGLKIARAGVPGLRTPILIDGEACASDLGAPALGEGGGTGWRT